MTYGAALHACLRAADGTRAHALIAEMDKKTRQKKKCTFVKSGATVFCRIATEKPICLETFDKNPQMGRFTLRDEGRTIAIGKVTKLPPAGK